MTFQEIFIKHLKEQGFEHKVEKDGDDILVSIINADVGLEHMTIVFDQNGNIADFWNPKNDRIEELETDAKENQKFIELGKAVETLSKLFKT